jgi:flagellar hook assembly protein FlgD
LPIANFSSLEQTEALKQQLQQAVSNNPDYRSVALLYR